MTMTSVELTTFVLSSFSLVSLFACLPPLSLALEGSTEALEVALEDALTVASKGSQSLHIVLTIVSGNLQKFRDDVSGHDDSPQLALGDVIALLHVDTALHCYLRTPYQDGIYHSHSENVYSGSTLC